MSAAGAETRSGCAHARADEPALAASFCACRAIARARARNFYYGLRLTPEPRRSAIFAVYAWMRAGDDEADAEGGADQRRARLAEFRMRTRSALSGDAPADTPEEPFWSAVTRTVHEYGIDHSVFLDMLDGLEEDLDHRGYETERQLTRYCHRVGATPGLACISVWGLRPGADRESARALAVDRGEAFQRTNILRDFAQDYDDSPRRIYLAQESFTAHGLSPEQLRRWSEPGRCGAFVREQAARARALYERSAPLDGMIDPACAPTLWAMTRIYAGLLGVVEREPRRVAMGPRIRLASARKAMIALTATLRSKWARR